MTLEGALQKICEHCGREIEVNVPELPCPTCGFQLSFPKGVDALNCPACDVVFTRVDSKA